MKLIRIILTPIRAVLRLLWKIIRAPFDLARRAVYRRSERHKKKRERYSPYSCIENLKEIGIEPDYVHVTFTEERGISWEIGKGEKKEKKTKSKSKEKTE